jgi:TRAP-type mannitol/chloroaromatic compound transport system substrate-binding protein
MPGLFFPGYPVADSFIWYSPLRDSTQVLRTPPEILTAFLKAWDELAAEESAKNPVFKKVYDSQREWASKVVPAKRFIAPPYSFAANHYWPQEEAKKAKPAAPAKP